MTMTYARLQEYLNAISLKANLDPSNSRHGVFWAKPYGQFISGTIPNKSCEGALVPIMAPDNPVNSAFYRILLGTWCGMSQMPKTGPFVTDTGYSIRLEDGTQITGAQIVSDIAAWLQKGAPEHG